MLGAVADAIAGADEETIDEWRAETGLWIAFDLAAADADPAPGNAIDGERLRRRHRLLAVTV